MSHPPPPLPSAAFDVVALAASAGGYPAVTSLLQALPADFNVPVILLQHLGPESTSTPEVYARRVPLAVEWARQDAVLKPRTLLVCPPRSFLQVLPDGRCVLSPCETGALEKPIDRFFDSIARSFGHRAIAVVLSGMGNDGAAGALEVHRAGGRVVVQSEASAEFPDMPCAAIEIGAADLVVPTPDLGQVIGEVVSGIPRPKARSELEAIQRSFGDKGEIATLAREMDWALTPIGPAIGWPAELRLMVRAAVDSAYPTAIWWGPDLIQMYNEAWRSFLGVTKHPKALGSRAVVTWREAWHEISPLVDRVMNEGVAVAGGDHQVFIERHGFLEEVFLTFSYSPIRNADGTVVGVRNTGWETTKNVVAERRMRALRALATGMAGTGTAREACHCAAHALATDVADVPFGLLYLLEKGRRHATLAGAAGVEPGSGAAPDYLKVAEDEPGWPLARALAQAGKRGAESESLLVDDLPARFPTLAATHDSAPHALPARQALLFPLRGAGGVVPVGVLVLALSPARPLDEGYIHFIELVAQQINAGIAEAEARQIERERHSRLAELDRAKTEFFANISHEFRTPLTLLVAPLEELLRQRKDLPAPLVKELDVAARNSRRLLTLVDNLLDFSQIERRRERAVLEPTDLCALTADIISAFRSAIESAGLELRLECDPGLPLVPVNREMWERIVSNLLSNAFKFTFSGGITVLLRARSLHVELVVVDSGVGIPETELPHLFKRFHRVSGARARTAEGSGIGLAIVHDLVSRMGGQLSVRSKEAVGTEFTLWIPLKSARQVAEEITGNPAPMGVAADLAREAEQWGSAGEPGLLGIAEDLIGTRPRPAEVPAGAEGPAEPIGRIVVADDNADMRDYLRRLLEPQWQVELAADGHAALTAIRRQPPDVILADVMMPGLDGFELLRCIREDEALARVPVILLTARSGEEAAIEGLHAGADDYIAKPFSPRELLARLRTVVERARADALSRGSEEQLATVFNALPVGVGVFNMEGGIVIANPEFQRFLPNNKMPSQDAERGWRWRAWHPDGKAVSPQDFPGARALRGERVVPGLEILHTRDDGTEIWTRVASVPIKDPAGRVTGAFTVLSDIDALKRSEERQSFLLELSDVVRPLTDPADILRAATRLLGEHLQVNRAHYGETVGDFMVVEHGYTHGLPPMIGRIRHQELDTGLVESCRQGRTAVCHDVTAEPTIAEKEATVIKGAGFYAYVAVPLMKKGEWVGTLIVHSAKPRVWTAGEVALVEETAARTWEAVERARAEAALREREADLARVQHVGGVGGIDIDVEGGLRRLCSPEYLRLHGLPDGTREESHEDWLARVHPDDRERAQQTLFTALRSDAAIYQSEYRIIRPNDGETRWIQVRADIVRAFDGKPLRLVGAHIDITAQKRMQDALQTSEDRLRLAVEIGELASWDWDVHSGKVTWNDRHFLMQGYAVGEVVPSYEAWLARVHPDDRQETVTLIETARDNRQPYAHAFRTLSPDGTVRRCSARGQFFYDERGEPYRLVGVMEDVTARWQAEEALRTADTELRASQRRLARELEDAQRLQAISQLFFEQENLQTLYDSIIDAAVAVMEADAASLQMLKPGKSELGLLAWRGFHPDSGAVWQCVPLEAGSAFGAALQQRQRLIAPDVFDPAFRSESGALAEYRRSGMVAVQSTPLVSRDGRVMGVLSTYWKQRHEPGERNLARLDVLARQAADVIERAQVQEALRESEERFRKLVEANTQAVWETNASGEVVTDSPSWRAYTGQTLEEWLGDGWVNAIHPEDQAHARTQWYDAVAAGCDVNWEYRLKHAASGWRWTNVRATPLLNPDGSIRKWVGMNMDIHARKVAEEALGNLAS